MQPHHAAALRSVVAGCQTAVKAVTAGMNSGTLVGLEDALVAAQGALRRAESQQRFLRRSLPHHARAVRVAGKVLGKARDVLYEADAEAGTWPNTAAVTQAAEAALRSAQAVLVEMDGPAAWRAPDRQQAG